MVDARLELMDFISSGTGLPVISITLSI
jgi:hypothetical protein